MMQISLSRPLHRPVVVAAFEGWNDAGESASAALDRLAEITDAEDVGGLDPEDYYDFQVNRPFISLDENGVRSIDWRTTSVLAGQHPGGPDVLLVRGIEPNIAWRAFTREIVEVCQQVDASCVVLLGALLADVPHGRPLPVTGVSSAPSLRDRLSLEPAAYSGPTGIVGVLADGLEQAAIPVVSYWVSVPYYVGQPPSPKATLALLRRVEDVLGAPVDPGDLASDAAAWDEAVTAMVQDDDELTAIVSQLEEQADAEPMGSADGDSIAAEFERYLRRRDPES